MTNTYYVVEIPYSSENALYHFGIKGQKWGIRRYQNPDGTLTAAGKARYGDLAYEKQNMVAAKKQYDKQARQYLRKAKYPSFTKKRLEKVRKLNEDMHAAKEKYRKSRISYLNEGLSNKSFGAVESFFNKRALNKIYSTRYGDLNKNDGLIPSFSKNGDLLGYSTKSAVEKGNMDLLFELNPGINSIYDNNGNRIGKR